jgi:hypothetical protein
MNSNLYRNASFYYVALGCLLLGWLVRHNLQEESDPVMRLRVAGAL